jgi:diguanylate cyclase (GGDEF)-like protein
MEPLSATTAEDEDRFVDRAAARFSLRKAEVQGGGVLFSAVLLCIGWREDLRPGALVVWASLVVACTFAAAVAGNVFRRIDRHGQDWDVRTWVRRLTLICLLNGSLLGSAPFVLLTAADRTERNLLFFGAGVAACLAAALGSQTSLHDTFVAFVAPLAALPALVLFPGEGLAPVLGVGLMGLMTVGGLYHVENHRTVTMEIRLRHRNAELARRLQASYDEILRISRDMAQTNAALHVALGQINGMASTDELTGLYNRRWFDERLESLTTVFSRIGEPLTLAIFDVDHFKAINDRFGHPAGDAVLRAIGGSAPDAVDGFGEVARIGGEEFAVVLPGSGPAEATGVAERLRLTIAAAVPAQRAELQVTVSIGVATLQPGMTATDLVASADAALYRAKADGRNRVATADALTVAAGSRAGSPP